MGSLVIYDLLRLNFIYLLELQNGEHIGFKAVIKTLRERPLRSLAVINRNDRNIQLIGPFPDISLMNKRRHAYESASVNVEYQSLGLSLLLF